MSYRDPIGYPNTGRPRCKATYPVACPSVAHELAMARCRKKAKRDGYCTECWRERNRASARIEKQPPHDAA